MESLAFQIWSIAPNTANSEFVTAGGDGKMVIWKDATSEKIEEENKKRRRQVEQEQAGIEELTTEKRLEYSRL